MKNINQKINKFFKDKYNQFIDFIQTVFAGADLFYSIVSEIFFAPFKESDIKRLQNSGYYKANMFIWFVVSVLMLVYTWRRGIEYFPTLYSIWQVVRIWHLLGQLGKEPPPENHY